MKQLEPSKKNSLLSEMPEAIDVDRYNMYLYIFEKSDGYKKLWNKKNNIQTDWISFKKIKKISQTLYLLIEEERRFKELGNSHMFWDSSTGYQSISLHFLKFKELEKGFYLLYEKNKKSFFSFKRVGTEISFSDYDKINNDWYLLTNEKGRKFFWNRKTGYNTKTFNFKTLSKFRDNWFLSKKVDGLRRFMNFMDHREDRFYGSIFKSVYFSEYTEIEEGLFYLENFGTGEKELFNMKNNKRSPKFESYSKLDKYDDWYILSTLKVKQFWNTSGQHSPKFKDFEVLADEWFSLSLENGEKQYWNLKTGEKSESYDKIQKLKDGWYILSDKSGHIFWNMNTCQSFPDLSVDAFKKLKYDIYLLELSIEHKTKYLLDIKTPKISECLVFESFSQETNECISSSGAKAIFDFKTMKIGPWQF